MVDGGALKALYYTLEVLGLKLNIDIEYSPPDWSSELDFYLSTSNDGRVIVEVKAPGIMNICTPPLEERYHEMTYKKDGTLADKVLSKVQLKITI